MNLTRGIQNPNMETTTTGEQRIEHPDHDSYSETKSIQDLMTHMNLTDCSYEEEEDDDDESEEEFSFMFQGANTPSIQPEDFEQVFPLFNRDLFFSGEENLPVNPPVKKVFVETNHGEGGHLVTLATPESDEITGPCCEWSGKAACKKSNSTGFSKFWRFKDLVGRSSSDGKDAFVFLDKSHAPPRAVVKRGSGEHGPPSSEAEMMRVRKSGRGKTAPLSAHAVYLKNKAKQEDRRRTYLPYRPELVGFFTNANVGLTKNLHPY